jgi:cell wall assembly regulator SMI1
MNPVYDAVHGIRRWLGAHAPALLDVLNPPAPVEAIEAFEQELGLVLPPAVRAAYALHDGEADHSDGIFGTRRWLPLAWMRDRHLWLRAIDPSFLPGFDATRFLPLFESGGGDQYYVVAGLVDGPVYEYEARVGPQPAVQYADLATFFEDFLRRLRANELVYRPEELMALIHRREWEAAAG